MCIDRNYRILQSLKAIRREALQSTLYPEQRNLIVARLDDQIYLQRRLLTTEQFEDAERSRRRSKAGHSPETFGAREFGFDSTEVAREEAGRLGAACTTVGGAV